MVALASSLHVKFPIFPAKPDEDAESHLICSNDRMNSKGIVEEWKCARFCLTLAANAHLWYESINPVDNDWLNLQKLFCQQLSKLGLTQKLFQRQSSFHFDEATDTIDSSVLWLKQWVVIVQEYLPTRYYYLLFGILNLIDAVQSAKRVMTNEKLENKLAG